MDLVWVQFYNNPPCMLGTPTFVQSFKDWAADLPNVKIYVGAPACPQCAGSGYQEASKLKELIGPVKGVKNFGGIMLWEASKAKLNGDYARKSKDMLRV